MSLLQWNLRIMDTLERPSFFVLCREFALFGGWFILFQGILYRRLVPLLCVVELVKGQWTLGMWRIFVLLSVISVVDCMQVINGTVWTSPRKTLLITLRHLCGSPPW